MSIFRSRRFPLVVLFCLILSWGVCTPTLYAHAGCPLAKHGTEKSCEDSGGDFKGLFLAMLVIAALLLLMRKNSEKTQDGLGDEGEDYYEEEYYTVYDLSDYCEDDTGKTGDDDSSDDDDDDDDDDKKQQGGQSGKNPVGSTTDEDEDSPGKTYAAINDSYFSLGTTSDKSGKDSIDRRIERRGYTAARAAEGTAYGLYVQTAGVAAIRGQSNQAKAISRAPNLIGISRQNTGAEQQNLYTLGNETLVTANRARARALRAIETVDRETISKQVNTTTGGAK